jgi:hypothetical protein
MDENTDYERRLDELDHAPSKPPLASWSGRDAERIGAAMVDPDTDATKLFSTLMGRPTLEERYKGRGRSVQRNVRLSESMDDYVNDAVRREGLSNRSEYFRLLVERDAQRHHDRTLVDA